MSVDKFQRICRTCSEFFCEDTILIPLSSEYTTEKNTTFKIIDALIILDLKIQENDGLPQQICSTCVNQVSNIHSFLELCKESQAILRTYFSDLSEFNLKINNENNTENEKNDIEVVRIDSKYSKQTFLQTCRTCSQFFCEDTILTPLSSEYSAEKNITFKIIDELISFDLKIQEKDGLPQHICTECVNQVSNIYAFLKSCKASQAILKTYLSELNLEINHKDNKKDKNELISISTECLMKVIKEEKTREYNFLIDDDSESLKNKKEINQSIQKNKRSISQECLLEIVKEENKDFWTDDSKSPRKEKKVSQKSSSTKTPINKCKKCNKYLYWSDNHPRQCGICLTKSTYDVAKLDFCCFYCEKIFESEKMIDVHILKTHPQAQPFTCSICNENFTIMLERRKHLQRLHFILDEFKCDICKKTFKSRHLLKSHQRTHADGEYKCEICSKEFTNLNRYLYHVSSHDPNKKFKCQYCDRTFMQLHHLKNHENSHTGRKPYVCESCGKSYSTTKNFKNHRGKHDVALPFVCNVCKKGFAYQGDFKRHLLKHDEIVRYLCNICKKEFIYEDELKIHLKTHDGHSLETQCTVTTEIRLYKCELCGKSYRTTESLNRHVKTHDGNKSFSCDDCEKCFNRKESLTSHMRFIHQGVARKKYAAFACSKCSKHCRSPAALEKHMKLHSELRKFACKECGNLYTTATNLGIHMNQVHLKKRPYSCPYCVQTFAQSSAQKLHIRFHKKEKPFKCLQCDKSFFEKYHLIAHERTHKGELPYSCLICLEKFQNNQALAKHTTKHTEEENRRIEDEIWAKNE